MKAFRVTAIASDRHHEADTEQWTVRVQAEDKDGAARATRDRYGSDVVVLLIEEEGAS